MLWRDDVSSAEASEIEGGFALVEALVAFMILVIGLVAIYIALGGALSGKSRGVAMTEAVRVARSELERFALIGPEPQVTSGQAGIYSWQRTVELGAVAATEGHVGYWVNVAVFDQSKKRLLTLTTYKLTKRAGR